MKLFYIYFIFGLVLALFSLQVDSRAPLFWRNIRDYYRNEWEPEHTISPFYKRQREIANIVHALLMNKEDERALEIIKKSIQLEKAWRRQVCHKYFGRTACEYGIRNTPFDMLKVAAVNYLQRDPTDEIIGQLRKSVGDLLENVQNNKE